MASAPTNLQTSRNGDDITVTWNKGANSHVLVRYSTSATPSSTTDGTILYKGTGTTCTLYNATPDTTYYFALWGADTSYSLGTATTINNNTGFPLGIAFTPEWIIVGSYKNTVTKSSQVEWIDRESLTLDTDREFEIGGSASGGAVRVRTSRDFLSPYAIVNEQFTKTIKLFRIDTAEVVATLVHTDRIRSCEMDREGEYVYFGDETGTIYGWAVADVVDAGAFSSADRFSFDPGGGDYIRDIEAYGDNLAASDNGFNFYDIDRSNRQSMSTTDSDTEGNAVESIAISDDSIWTGAKNMQKYARSDLTSGTQWWNPADDITAVNVDDPSSVSYVISSTDATTNNVTWYNSSGTLLNTFTELNTSYAEDSQVSKHLGQLMYCAGQQGVMQNIVVRDYLDFTYSSTSADIESGGTTLGNVSSTTAQIISFS